ncbi:MAG: DUF4093 domain-containing protein [Clostridiales bacterium]|nr:DUF4093 domain-containing protein [Candidatus Equinaster intestinalis]
MIRLNKTVIVEGKYDKIRLQNIIDAPIIETGGFRIFKDNEKRKFIRMLAEKTGIIVLTDSDSAGALIRNHIKNIAPEGEVICVYLPKIEGKEKRKAKGGKEGIVGVEGTPDDVIIGALERFTVEKESRKEKITKTDFFNLGLSGNAQSRALRENLCKALELPSLSASALLETVNFLYSREEFLLEAQKWQEAKTKN